MAAQVEGEGDAEALARLLLEREELQARCDFLDELVGPVESQRKQFQQQLLTARSAALRAAHRGVSIPSRWVGRLDERLLASRGLSRRDRALLQGGCVDSPEGIPQDVSLLGDPGFKPYKEHSHQPEWEARGGSLRLSLGDIRERWGEDVALEVVRCAVELDAYDASRRIGIELPWHAGEGRELLPSEVIYIMEQELSAQGPSLETRAALGSSSVVDARDYAGSASSPFSAGDSTQSDPEDDEELVDQYAALGLLDGLTEHERYGWSLTDADVQALLCAASKPQASPEERPHEDFLDGLDEEMLLELLEADVIGAANLLAATPDLPDPAD